MNEQSKPFSLNQNDLIKIGTGLLVAAVGAIVTYAAQYFAETDFGQWTPAVVAASSVIINAARKFLAGWTITNEE